MHGASGRLARYDAVADWYDTNAAPPPETLAALVDLLGPGHGRCLDLGCGTGHYLSTIRSTGREPFGIDLSWGQLRHASVKEPKVVHGDGAILPFPTGSFATVAAIWVTTDVDDLGATLGEAARVLEPGGQLVILGVHPCFNGPCVETLDDGGVSCTPPIARRDGTRPPRGGAPRGSAGGWACATSRWRTTSMR